MYLCRNAKDSTLQKLLSIGLLFAFAAQCFSQWGVLAGYELNKDYIAEFLCINRDKPAMHCDGKCYLRMKMKQDQQRKDAENGNVGNKIDIALFCSHQRIALPATASRPFDFRPLVTPFYNTPHFTFFHPPRA